MKQVHFKRIISMLIAVAMLVTMVPATFAATADDFVDFPTGWSKEAMEFSVDNDLLKGKSADKIEPAANLTRAEMATIINRAFGAKVTEDISSYIDVKPTDWFYTEMQKAVNMETFRGDGNGKLRPNDAITREEVMAVIARAMVLEQSDYSPLYKYADYNEFAEWAKPYAAALVAGGYVNGLGNGKIHPKVNITREEFAQLMYNIFKTYHTEAGTYNTVTPQNCVMLNQPGITLENVTVYGDLVLGDGVGEGIVNITNVTIKGRLLARGGNITLTNVTTDGGVVVKNVNGTTHFNNYKSEAVFNGVVEHTYTTYKSYNVSPGSTVGRPGGGGGGGGGSSTTNYYDYTINYYYMNLDDIKNGIVHYDLVETITEKSIKSGTKVTLEAKPVRDGYTYVFNADPSSVDSDTETVTITSDIAYHIYYDLQTVKVVAPDGSAQVVAVKNEKTVREAVAETGLGETETVIDGKEYGIKWYVVKDGESKDDNNVDTDGEWTSVIPDGYHLEYELYADVTLNYNDGATPDKKLEILVGADGSYTISAEDLAAAARDGYRFDGWFDADGKEYTGATLITASQLVITAKWTPLYDVYFRTNKGDTAAYSHQIVAEGEMATKPEQDPVKAGYNFIQWVVYDDAGNAVAYDFTKPVTGDLEIVAKWEPVGSPTVYYDVTFMSDGAVYTTARVESGKTVARPATDPSKTGYTFVGWYTESGVAYDFSAAVTGNLTLVAKWEPVTSPVVYCDVTFMSDGAVYTTARVESGKTVARPATDPTKTGYTFVGWYTESGVAYDFSAAVTANLTLVAKWEPVTSPVVYYDVTFMSDGSVYTTARVESGKTVARPATDPTKAGYTFAGWYTEAGVAYDFATPVTGNLTLVAKWDAVVVPPTVYTVTFMLNSTDVYTTQQVEENKTATKPTDPTLDGYTFAGWYTESGVEYDFATPVTGNLTLIAKWEQFYTVYFHDMVNDTEPLEPFDYAKINVANEEADRNLAYLNKTLDGIYQGRLEQLPAYDRNDLGYNNLGTKYSHSVEYEYIYEATPGSWEVFTEDTTVDRDIHVYYASKHAVLNVTIPGLDLPLLGDNVQLFDVYYDSQSRFADSLKDILISMGSTLEKRDVKDKVNEKVVALYDKLSDETGMIDADGNILDKDYGMKIIDVIDYDQIQAEVKLYIENMLNGTAEDLEAVISLIDIATLVDEIGGRELINAIGIESIRSMLKEDAYKDKTIGYIQKKIKEDPDVIVMVLNSNAKDSLIDKAASNDKFIVALIDNETFRTEILNILKTEKKTQLLEYLAKESLKNEILDIIKKDSDFNALIADDTFIADVTDIVKDSQAFKDILTGNGNYKKNIVSQIKNEKLEELVKLLNEDISFKKKMVEKVGEPGKTEAEMSEFAKNTKKAIMDIMQSKYPDVYAKVSGVTNGYEAVVEYYVKGNCDSFPNVDFSRREFETEFIPMINGVIDTVIEEYFAYDPSNPASVKPDGYDIIHDYFDAEIDGVIDDVLSSYVNGDYDDAAEGTADYELKKFIDNELAAHIKTALSDYVNPEVTMDAEVEKLIDDTLIGFVEDYLNGVALDADVVSIIESNIITFIKDYFSGNSSLVNDAEIKNLADGIKTEFVNRVKAADVEKIKQPVIDFVSDSENADFVNTFVTDNYTAIVDAVDDTFISSYINSMSDKELNELVKEYADTEMIVNHIVNLSVEERKKLANKIVKFLDSYTPYIEFMEAFKNKRDTFEVNKDNIHFVTAVGKAIHGFDFDEILEILKGKGFTPVIEFIGEDVVEDIFVASKENYWAGLEPVVDQVKADGITREYTTKMNITINVPLLLESIYDNNAGKFRERVENNNIYDYDKNTSLKKFVNIDWFDLFMGYDATRVDEATGVTGYYIRDYMDYYTAVLDTLIIFDDALCFYNAEDYTDDELILVKKSLTQDVITFLKELEALSDKIENGQPIYGSYTLQDLIDKVESLNDVAASLDGTALEGQAGNIEAVVNNVKSILENLGEGNLPAGYTLDDLNVLSAKLIKVIEGMNEGEYDSVNETFNEVITSALNKLDSILDELDKDGTIAGRPIDSIFAKISVLNKIYNRFASQIKSVISALADVDFGSIDIEADVEKYEDIIFGREVEDIFNIDSVVDLVKDRFNNDAGISGYFDTTNGYYVIDEYSKDIKDYNIFFQRRFY